MLPQYVNYKRRAIAAYSVALMSTTALAVIVLAPKPAAYADPERPRPAWRVGSSFGDVRPTPGSASSTTARARL
jgi:hypothetical protein